MTHILIYRWFVFLLAAIYCLRALLFGSFDVFGGPFRFLTIWALFASFFCASRMMALMEGRSTRRWDGFVSMTAVINSMVVIMYWRLYFADPTSVTADGRLADWRLELYLHGLGPLLQVCDGLFVHRSFRRPRAALGWLLGVLGSYILWMELALQRMNDTPFGAVTSGLPYRFLNDLDLSGRVGFYGTNFGAGLALLGVFTAIAWGVRRRFPVPATP